MKTLLVDEAVVPVIERQVELEKQRLRRKIEKYEAELAALEATHQMSTADFLHRYHRGELGDDESWIRWEFVQATRQRLQEKLQGLENIVYASAPPA